MAHIFVYRVIATPVLAVHCICQIVTRTKAFSLHTCIVQSHQFQSVYFSAWLEDIPISLEALLDPIHPTLGNLVGSYPLAKRHRGAESSSA